MAEITKPFLTSNNDRNIETGYHSKTWGSAKVGKPLRIKRSHRTRGARKFGR
jgi:hypothetical protein